jgi:ornithine cyclodeaminase
MRIIDLATVQSAVSYSDAVESVRGAFATLAAGGAITPNEFLLSHPLKGDVHVKGAHLIGSSWMVTKVVSGGFAIASNHGCSLVFSSQSGELVAMIDDGGWLTEMRTAAAGALSIELLARHDAKTVAVIGSGIQARYQLECLRAIRNVGEVRVAGRTATNVQAFAHRHNAVACATVDDAIRGADIVICATTSTQPVLDWVDPGTHITAIGADMAGKRELSTMLIRNATTVVVDDIALACQAGILQNAGNLAVTTMSQLVSDPSLGRGSDDDITIAGLCGLGIQDAAITELVMSRLEW